MSEIREACGVVGLYSTKLAAAKQIYFALFALQHRGQESSGMATSDFRRLYVHKRMGLVSQVFRESSLQKLKGSIGIGHNRYSTSSCSDQDNAQPFVVQTSHGEIAVAHNGNLVNYQGLHRKLAKWGVKLADQDPSDSALIAHLIAYMFDKTGDLAKATQRAYDHLRGSFSLVIMSKDTLIALRDRNGLRPLCLGSIPEMGHIVCSETCALAAAGAKFVREVEPGEMVVFTTTGLRSVQLAPADPKLCIFEFIYTSRPDSILMGRGVYETRKRLGLRLAMEAFPEADVVIPVPDTAIPVAIGYSHATGIPFEEGLIKSRYIHRTFIEPDPNVRQDKVRMKLTPLTSIIAGKRVVLIDDSIVRGTTSRELIKLIKNAGAKEVHFLVSSPPIRYPDFYGIDIPNNKDLIAANMSLEEIRDYLGADSLHYLSLEGTIAAINVPAGQLCTSCFTGEYPVWPEQLEEPEPAAKSKVKQTSKVKV